MKSALPAPKPEPSLPREPSPALSPRTASVEAGERPLGKRALIAVLLVVFVAVVYEHEPARIAAAKTVQALRTAAVSIPRRSEPQTEQATTARVDEVLPEIAERLLESATSLALGPLREVADLSSEGMQAALEPDGRVLLTSKYRVLSLGAGHPHDRRTLFSPEMYRVQFPDARVQAMASAVALPGQRYLLGGWHGEVLLASEDGLRVVSAREQRPKGRVADLHRWGDTTLVAGDGLWRLRTDGEGLEEMPLPNLRRLVAIGVQGDQVLLAEDGRRIHRWTGTGAEPWLELPRDDARVQVLVPAIAGGWWIGSTRGLLRVDREGRVLESLLDGVWISAVLERPGELWVGSWKQGLLLRRADRWYRLGEEPGGLSASSVSGMVVDAADHAWLTLYGGGGWHAPLPSLRDALLTRPWSPESDAPG